MYNDTNKFREDVRDRMKQEENRSEDQITNCEELSPPSKSTAP